jgi:hypothetical protein
MAVADPASASVTAADQDAEQALILAEDLRLLEALNPLKLTAEQINQVLPILDGAQARWKELDAERMKALAARKKALAEARSVALQGGRPSSRLQEQLLLFQESSTMKQEGQRRDHVLTIAAKLPRILSSTQIAQIRTHTAAVVTGKPSAFALARVTSAGIAAAPFELDDDPEKTPEEKFLTEMAKLRKAKGPEIDVRRNKFADKFLSGLDPDSPEYKTQLDAFMKTASEIHAMRPEQYEQEKQALAERFAQIRAVAKARKNARESAEQFQEIMEKGTGLEFFVDQILLSARAPAVLREMRTKLASR